MIKLLLFFLCSLFLFGGVANRADADVIFLPLSGSSNHKFSSPYTGQFQAINGNYFDVSEYYSSSSLELSFNGLILWDARNDVKISVPWNFDYGYESDLFETSPVLQLGMSINLLNQNKSFTLGVTNLLTLGGHISETPCVDSLSREFHCGTGLPWVDKPKPVKNDLMTLIIRYRIKF